MKDLEPGWAGPLTSFWEVRSRQLCGEWSGDIMRGHKRPVRLPGSPPSFSLRSRRLEVLAGGGGGRQEV